MPCCATRWPSSWRAKALMRSSRPAAIAEARARRWTTYAFAIIDQNLPDGSGEGLARELRSKGFAAPILLLAAMRRSRRRGSERIAKPFRFAALLARLNAHARPPCRGEDRRRSGSGLICSGPAPSC